MEAPRRLESREHQSDEPRPAPSAVGQACPQRGRHAIAQRPHDCSGTHGGSSMTQAPLLRPLGTALGTEVVGIDLSKPLDAETFAWIQAAFAEHPVLVFRDQDLGAPDLAAFGRRFGAPRPHALIKYRHVDCPEVSWLTNVEETGEIDWYGV